MHCSLSTLVTGIGGVGGRKQRCNAGYDSELRQSEVGVRNLKLDAKRMRGKRREPCRSYRDQFKPNLKVYYIISHIELLCILSGALLQVLPSTYSSIQLVVYLIVIPV